MKYIVVLFLCLMCIGCEEAIEKNHLYMQLYELKSIDYINDSIVVSGYNKRTKQFDSSLSHQ